jgi:hypothetical protein
MADHIDEQSVVRAAREWAARYGKGVEMVVVSAYETMAALKTELAPDKYDTALRDLYHRYNDQ